VPSHVGGQNRTEVTTQKKGTKGKQLNGPGTAGEGNLTTEPALERVRTKKNVGGPRRWGHKGKMNRWKGKTRKTTGMAQQGNTCPWRFVPSVAQGKQATVNGCGRRKTQKLGIRTQSGKGQRGFLI